MKLTFFALVSLMAVFQLCVADEPSAKAGMASTILIVPSNCNDAHALSLCGVFDQAFASNDADALSRLLADGAMHVSPMGKAMTKEALIKDIRSKELCFVAYKTNEVDFIQQKNDMIVIAGMLEATAERFQIKVEGQFRFVRVLMTSPTHGWQEVYSQITPVKGASMGRF